MPNFNFVVSNREKKKCQLMVKEEEEENSVLLKSSNATRILYFFFYIQEDNIPKTNTQKNCNQDEIKQNQNEASSPLSLPPLCWVDNLFKFFYFISFSYSPI